MIKSVVTKKNSLIRNFCRWDISPFPGGGAFTGTIQHTHTHTGIRQLCWFTRLLVYCARGFTFVELGLRQQMYKFFAGDAIIQ